MMKRRVYTSLHDHANEGKQSFDLFKNVLPSKGWRCHLLTDNLSDFTQMSGVLAENNWSM